MKKFATGIASLFLITLTLLSCNGGGPKANAEKFLNSVYHLDYASAKEVSTDWTKKQLEAYEQYLTILPETAKAEFKRVKVEVKDAKVTGDTALVSYTVSSEPKSIKQMKMIREKGKWLAEFSKNPVDNFGGGMSNDYPVDVPDNAAIDTQLAPPADASMKPYPDTSIH